MELLASLFKYLFYFYLQRLRKLQLFKKTVQFMAHPVYKEF